MSLPHDPPAPSLRERKKAKTRMQIQATALRLFRAQGYDATTIQQIIEQAEVSESTFFRYFPTKTELVFWDDFDPLIVEAFRGQPRELSPIQALRAAFHEVFDRLSTREAAEERGRMLLMLSVPELRAAMLDQLVAGMRLVAGVFAERMERDPDEMAMRTFAGVVIGASLAVMFAMKDDPEADISVLLDEAMGHLEAGFA